MRLGGGNILAKQLAVDVDRGIDLGHHGVGLCGKPPTPHLVAHARSAIHKVVGKSTVPRIMTVAHDTTSAAPKRRKFALIAAAAIAALGVAAVYVVASYAGHGRGTALPGALPPG